MIQRSDPGTSGAAGTGTGAIAAGARPNFSKSSAAFAAADCGGLTAGGAAGLGRMTAGAGAAVLSAIPDNQPVDGLLVVDALSKNFGGHQAVHQVSFALRAGAIGGLIGPNGAGKTTLFNCLTGFMPASSGRVLLDGVSIAGRPASAVFAAGLARTFQIPRPFPEMSVLENVMLAPRGQIGERFWTNWLRPAVVARQERQTLAAARHWLDFVGLSSLVHEPARILSGADGC